MLQKEKHNDLLQKALNIKKRFLQMYQAANAGHIGSSLSCAEMLTFIRFYWMNETDEIILSKGHAAASLYSLLAEDGTLSQSDIETYYKNNTYLAAHPPAGKIKRIPFATGSLGHGLSIAAGLGLASKLKKNNKKVFCVCSDGELNEGSTWEAALFIVHQKLKNVVWFIDRNRLQGFGRTEDVMQMEPLADKLKAFGFEVLEADGHDFNSLATVQNIYGETEKPIAIICNTIKGRSWKQFEDKLDSHYLPMKDNMFNSINAEIELHYQQTLIK